MKTKLVESTSPPKNTMSDLTMKWIGNGNSLSLPGQPFNTCIFFQQPISRSNKPDLEYESTKNINMSGFFFFFPGSETMRSSSFVLFQNSDIQPQMGQLLILLNSEVILIWMFSRVVLFAGIVNIEIVLYFTTTEPNLLRTLRKRFLFALI